MKKNLTIISLLLICNYAFTKNHSESDSFIKYAMKDSLIIKELVVNDIPILICYINDNAKKDLLILSHGFTGSKENWSGKMETLAEMGFFTVALDNRYHGKREGLSFKEKILTSDGRVDLLMLRKVMNETAADISVLIDHFSKHEMVNSSNIGMIGISMGGFVTYASLVNDERISFAVPIVSSPFWDDIPEDTNVLNTDEALQEFKEYAELNSPANKSEKFYPRKIFALIGTKDKHFKAERVKDFYSKLESNYGTNKNYIKISQYEVGHVVTDTMWNDVLKWMKDEILVTDLPAKPEL